MKNKISMLFKQPSNPSMPRPIFLIILGIIVLVFGGNLLFKSLPKKTASDSNKQNSEQSESVVESYENTEKVPLSTKIKDLLSTEIGSYVSPVVSLPEIPKIEQAKDQIYDEELLNNSITTAESNFEIEDVPNTNLGRIDPMKPLDNNTEDVVLSSMKLKYYSHKDLDKFYSEESSQLSKIPETERIEYNTYEEALASGKIPSKEASERYLKEKDNYLKLYGDSENIINPLNDESVGYYTGINIEDIVIMDTGINDENFKYVDLYVLGGKFFDIKIGEYINGEFYIKDIKINKDPSKRSITVLYKNKEYIIGYSEEGASNLKDKIEDK